MSFADELVKLDELRRQGALSAAEFEQAKRKLLESEHPSGGPADAVVANHLAESNYHAELARIDREWNMEREKYLAHSRYGRSYVPTAGGSIVGMVVMGGFAIFWTLMALGIGGGMMMADVGPFGFIGLLFPLFGVLFFVFAIYAGMSGLTKSRQYAEAEECYRQRRAAVQRDGTAPQKPI